jgi:hypothetical protein
VKSTAPRVAAASPDLWHERLAHCGPEAVEHLPTPVTGVKITAGPSATESTTCAVGITVEPSATCSPDTDEGKVDLPLVTPVSSSSEGC